MTTQTTSVANQDKTDPGRLLALAVRANGIFSEASGLFLLLASSTVAEMLGINAPWIVTVMGLGLVVYGGFLIYASMRGLVNAALGRIVVVLDLVWVAGAVLLLLGNLLDMTTAGRWFIAIIADIVLLFAIVQAIGVRRLRRG